MSGLKKQYPHLFRENGAKRGGKRKWAQAEDVEEEEEEDGEEQEASGEEKDYGEEEEKHLAAQGKAVKGKERPIYRRPPSAAHERVFRKRPIK